MKRTIYILAILAFLYMGFSCQKYETPSGGCLSSVELSDGTVLSRLQIEIDPEVEVSFEGTRAIIDDPSADIKTQLKDLWILHFDETDSLAGLKENLYFPSFKSYVEDSLNQVRLVAKSSPQRLVVLANTCDKDFIKTGRVPLNNVLDRRMNVSCQDDLFGDGGDGNRYIMYNGVVYPSCIDGSSLGTLVLKRNCAKVTFTITNNDTDDDVKITGYQFCSVPDKATFLTNIPADIPGISQLTVFPNPHEYKTFNYEAETLEVAEGSTSSAITVYLPVNMRGTITNPEGTEEYKNNHHPDGATYLRIFGEVGSTPVEVSYTFYLGDVTGTNYLTDFNLRPNYHYKYNFNINGAARGTICPIFRENIICLNESANCYILNPPAIGKKTYRITIKRNDEFWNSPFYEDVENNTIGLSKTWEAFVVWCEDSFGTWDACEAAYLTKKTGTGIHDYFEVTVPAGASGNMLVGIKPQGCTEDMTWSWHLWVTDYDPSEAYNLSPIAGQYYYAVPGGRLHRYNGNAWNGGSCSQSFIMDRNLGNLRPSTSSPVYPDERGGLFYQFGSKNPQAKFGKSPFSINTTRIGGFHGYNAGFPYINISEMSGNHLYYSITHPYVRIVSDDHKGDWIRDSKYDYKWIKWADPYAGDGKSLFDPCPPGYKITETLDNTNHVFQNCTKTDYWPGPVEEKPSENINLYSPYILYYGVSTTGSSSAFWTSRTHKTVQIFYGVSVVMGSNYFYQDTDEKTTGMAIRCITEK